MPQLAIAKERLPPLGLEIDEEGPDCEKIRDFIGDFRGNTGKCGLQEADKDQDMTFDDFQKIGKLVSSERARLGLDPGVELDPNHSHFIFADDGSMNKFMAETKLRADIESCIAGSSVSAAPLKEFQMSKHSNGLHFPLSLIVRTFPSASCSCALSR